LFFQGELLEILYEPDIPWLKCITMSKHKESVTRTIKDLLLELMNLEVIPLDFEDQKDMINTEILQADVTMKAPEPRLISWAVYQSRVADIYDTFAEYQYPSSMTALPYKAIWRGLEDSKGRFEDFLSNFRRLIKSEAAPVTVADFCVCNECQITYNMRGDLLYIGSFVSAAALKNIVRKLETMMNLLVSMLQYAQRFTTPNAV
jgi:hypothetical protein